MRYRSGFANNKGEEFDAPFARLEYVADDVFDISWYRHTGRWHPLFSRPTLDEAIDTLATEGILAPKV